MHSDRNSPETRLTLFYAAALGVLTVGYRLVAPYQLFGIEASFAWNLMPVGALALFVGARMPSPWGWLVPFVAMFVSDLLLIPAYAAQGSASISWDSTPFIYLSFLLYAVIGRLARPSIDSPLRLLGSALAGAVQFFLVTNFAVWVSGLDPAGNLYPKTPAGLIYCYEMALPFSKGTFLSDLLFTSLFFAGHAAILSVSRSPSAQEAV